MLSPSEQRQMLVEEVQLYTEAIQKMGTWVQGSRNQEILNPALASRRAALEAIRKLDAKAPEEVQNDLEDFLSSAGD